MSQKNMKLLRRGAKKFKLPYESLKSSFKSLDTKQKGNFLKVARMIDYLPDEQ